MACTVAEFNRIAREARSAPVEPKPYAYAYQTFDIGGHRPGALKSTYSEEEPMNDQCQQGQQGYPRQTTANEFSYASGGSASSLRKQLKRAEKREAQERKAKKAAARAARQQQADINLALETLRDAAFTGSVDAARQILNHYTF